MIFKYAVICLMALVVLFLIHLLIISVNYIDGAALDHDAPKTPSGLYAATDKIALLTVNNFNENVYNSTNAWIVQFYNSWCGHCIKFSPKYKQLAASIYNWRNVIVLGAIDCADDQNTQHCRDYEIMGYPTIRYFPPLQEHFTLGKEVERKSNEPESLVSTIIDHLQKTETKVSNWPDFSSVNSDNLKSLWNDDKSRLLILVVEKDDSYIGRQLIMDLFGVHDLIVRYTFNADFADNKQNLPQVLAIKPDLSRNQIHLENTTRIGVFHSVRKYLLNENYNVPDIGQVQSTDTNQVKVKQSNKQQQLVNKLFMEDLESSLTYSLFHEVTLKPKITGDAMSALKNYLHIIDKYFPPNPKIHNLISAVIADLQDISSTTGGDFKRLIIDHSKSLGTLKNKAWVSCKGSTAKYRGYPCSVWMTFHTLTVNAFKAHDTISDNAEILQTMANYIKNFFGCQECAEHFQQMSQTIQGNVTSRADAVLWLWKAHNTVNKRLSGDFSEDPAFPKIQFPAKKMCPECRHDNETWREDKVLSYLVNMYSTVYNVIETSDGEMSTEFSKLVKEKLVLQKENPDSWNFSFSDIKTCIALYVLCACFLTVYTIRFFLKRNRKSRNHKFEFYNKA